ncbi:MAG: hypothetical protein ACR2RV_25710 [Verrucomicrobiales bacterium]
MSDMPSPDRVLYFDIDGVLLNLSEDVKHLLTDGALERELKRLSFSSLVCVSDWVEASQDNLPGAPVKRRGSWIRSACTLQAVFPDENWFIERLHLAEDTGSRGRVIDMTKDWYYVDDWAREFLGKEFGDELYQREKGRRVLMPDPCSDGSDILDWLQRIPVNGTS